jgi:hypothetical protein
VNVLRVEERARGLQWQPVGFVGLSDGKLAGTDGVAEELVSQRLRQCKNDPERTFYALANWDNGYLRCVPHPDGGS